MSFLKKVLALSLGIASLGEVYAKLDLSSSSNVVVYWGRLPALVWRLYGILTRWTCISGQNSFAGTGDLTQQRLGYYCDG